MKEDTIKHLFQEQGRSDKVLSVLIGSTKKRLYGVLRKMLVDHNVVDDVLQRTYIKAFEKLNQFDWKSNIETWVYRIAINTALDEIRSRKRRETMDISTALSIETEQSPNYEGALELLNKGLKMLPKRQCEIFVMKYFEDLAIQEIAEITGLSEGGIRSSYHIAKNKLQRILEKNEYI